MTLPDTNYIARRCVYWAFLIIAYPLFYIGAIIFVFTAWIMETQGKLNVWSKGA
jgi:hypothetical protein